eukprot:m.93867 g.93867  ORF g.93867 m.93867 type:complete len:460 (+) comp12191_c0_seq1:241-1620(+)
MKLHDIVWVRTSSDVWWPAQIRKDERHAYKKDSTYRIEYCFKYRTVGAGGPEWVDRATRILPFSVKRVDGDSKVSDAAGCTIELIIDGGSFDVDLSSVIQAVGVQHHWLDHRNSMSTLQLLIQIPISQLTRQTAGKRLENAIRHGIKSWCHHQATFPTAGSHLPPPRRARSAPTKYTAESATVHNKRCKDASDQPPRDGSTPVGRRADRRKLGTRQRLVSASPPRYTTKSRTAEITKTRTADGSLLTKPEPETDDEFEIEEDYGDSKENVKPRGDLDKAGPFDSDTIQRNKRRKIDDPAQLCDFLPTPALEPTLQTAASQTREILLLPTAAHSPRPQYTASVDLSGEVEIQKSSSQSRGKLNPTSSSLSTADELARGIAFDNPDVPALTTSRSSIFKCTKCHFTSTESMSAIDHFWHHNAAKRNLRKGIVRFGCGKCDFRATTEDAVRQHKSVHKSIHK